MNIYRIPCFGKETFFTLVTVISLGFACSALANVYIVNDPGDSNAASICDGTATCTLRQAIVAANGNPGHNVIDFNINNHAAGPFSIKPLASLGPLPIINRPVTIDGFSQAGVGVHAIELSGELLPACNVVGCANDVISPPSPTSSGYAAGLLLVGRDKVTGAKLATNPDGSIIKGLAINKFPRQGVYLYGVDNVTIVGNYIGIDTTGTLSGYQNGRLLPAAGISPPHDSIRVEAGNNNFIGTTQADYANNTIQSVNRNVFGAASRSFLSLAYLNENIRGFAGCDPVLCNLPQIGFSNNVVQGNYMGTDATGSCIIGGIGTLVNATYTPLLCSGPGNSSTRALSSSVVGVFLANAPLVTSGNNVIGGLNPGQGNVMVSSQNPFVFLQGIGAQFLGNIMGRDATGTVDLLGSITNSALVVFDTTNAVLNKNIIARNNLNSGVNGSALNLSNSTPALPPVLNTNLTVVNNQVVDNFRNGINFSAALGKFGFDIKNGQIIPMPNVVANNQGTGIFLQQLRVGGNPISPSHVAMLYNSIYANNTSTAPGLLGIDLIRTITPPTFSADGPNINVPSNINSGPNNLQNFPVLDPINSFANPALVQVYGSLDSAPNNNYVIQAFSNDSAVCLQLNPTPPAVMGYQPSPPCTTDSGFATSFLESQGHVFIGETTVTTDANGHANFHFPAKVNVPIGSVITATATLLTTMPDQSVVPTDTSEFSQAIDANKVGSPNAYIHADGAAGGDNGQAAADPCQDQLSVESLTGQCGQ